MKTLLILIIISAILLALCFAGLALNILLRKNGKFPETEVGDNKHMRRLGITCVKQDELSRWKKQRSVRRKAGDTDCESCAVCADCNLKS